MSFIKVETKTQSNYSKALRFFTERLEAFQPSRKIDYLKGSFKKMLLLGSNGIVFDEMELLGGNLMLINPNVSTIKEKEIFRGSKGSEAEEIDFTVSELGDTKDLFLNIGGFYPNFESNPFTFEEEGITLNRTVYDEGKKVWMVDFSRLLNQEILNLKKSVSESLYLTIAGALVRRKASLSDNDTIVFAQASRFIDETNLKLGIKFPQLNGVPVLDAQKFLELFSVKPSTQEELVTAITLNTLLVNSASKKSYIKISVIPSVASSSIHKRDTDIELIITTPGKNGELNSMIGTFEKVKQTLLYGYVYQYESSTVVYR